MALGDAFGPFDGNVWLDCAHQGPLPAPARRAALLAIEQKTAPHRIADASFAAVPRSLKHGLAALIGAATDEIVLGNSTTYGLHLLAHGLPLQAGDEVLLVAGDFPATVYPWLARRRDGVRTRLLRPAGPVVTAEDVERALRPRTRVLCTSWVFSLSGWAAEIAAIGRLCRQRGVTFVVNASQALGARPLAVRDVAVDALVCCGFKWLCGPYATGFAWIRPELRDTLTYEQPYWLAHLDGGLDRAAGYELREDLGAAAFDVFGTANFLSFMPWDAAVRHLLAIGVDRIAAHDQALVDRLLEGVDRDVFAISSPLDGGERSTLVFLAPRERHRAAELHARLAAAGVSAALRGDSLRFAPHLYNAAADIDQALEALR
jgi:selenocysteine lyase/cysteine desulfurase